MARIASQSKGGYYPTPIKELELLSKHFKVEKVEDGHRINMLDPCAGKGEAVSLLSEEIQKQVPVQSYGVELEETRAAEMKTQVDKGLCEGYQQVRTEPKYHAMYLNPPYDEVNSERTELRFLRTLSSTTKNVLLPGGLLLFCVPQAVIKNCSGILSTRFHDFRVYRFTDEHYPRFNQVILMAYYGKPKLKATRKENREYLNEIAEMDPNDVPTLEEIEEDIQLVSSNEEVTIFRGDKLSVEELNRDLATSPIFEEIEQNFKKGTEQVTMKNPMLPLKTTHGGVAVASGAIGGNMGNHLVTGITKPVTDHEEKFNEEGRKVSDIYTKHFKSVVRVFNENGVHELN